MTNILDTVEPDAWMKQYPVGWDGQIFICVKDKSKLSTHPAELYKSGIYSRETVESLLEAHRKQVLLGAAERLDRLSNEANEFERPNGYTCARELRRMAEGENS
jgi:hypothetical protein